MVLINWQDLRNPKMLIDSLEGFLVKVFSLELLEEEAYKLERFVEKGDPKEFKYLKSVSVHRAAKWYKLIKKIKEQGYSFDLKFPSTIEEFMKLILFAYSLDTLIQHDIIQLNRKEVEGWLRDRDRFESLLYEVIIASNYSSNGFYVEFPELFGKRIDIHAKKGEVVVNVECKTLRRNEKYVDIAVELGSWLHRENVNILLDIMVPKTPKTEGDVEEIVNLVKRAIKEDRQPEEKGIKVSLTKLPEHLYGPFQVNISSPDDIEFALSSSYVRLSEKGFEVKEPKIIILRNPNKYEEVSKRLGDRLKEAYRQLKGKEGRKVIYIDVSEVVGRPLLQLPELIRLSVGPELLFSQLEAFAKSWLERHVEVDAIVMTEPKLYIDPSGIPYALTLECKAISSYTAPGWTIEMHVIPQPEQPLGADRA